MSCSTHAIRPAFSPYASLTLSQSSSTAQLVFIVERSLLELRRNEREPVCWQIRWRRPIVLNVWPHARSCAPRTEHLCVSKAFTSFCFFVFKSSHLENGIAVAIEDETEPCFQQAKVFLHCVCRNTPSAPDRQSSSSEVDQYPQGRRRV